MILIIVTFIYIFLLAIISTICYYIVEIYNYFSVEKKKITIYHPDYGRTKIQEDWFFDFQKLGFKKENNV
jgi:hypothetical protein